MQRLISKGFLRHLTFSSRVGFAAFALCAAIVAPACSQAQDNPAAPSASTATSKVPLWGRLSESASFLRERYSRDGLVSGHKEGSGEAGRALG